jgi:hypothetical protein
MIRDLIIKVIEVNDSLTSKSSEKGAVTKVITKIPTLKQSYYRPISPMLKERYAFLSYWRNATHGDWLSTDEMELLWLNNSTPYINQLKHQLKAFSENWINDASSLFKDYRISVFAIEENGNEHIYLIWFDDIEEPELWVYDSNGMARYKNIKDYLDAYLSDEMSAYSAGWILAL